jgi:hypothetical protein
LPTPKQLGLHVNIALPAKLLKVKVVRVVGQLFTHISSEIPMLPSPRKI